MAKPNYGFEKRQRELAKKKKQEEKDARKREARAAAASTSDAAPPPGADHAGASEAPDPQGPRIHRRASAADTPTD